MRAHCQSPALQGPRPVQAPAQQGLMATMTPQPRMALLRWPVSARCIFPGLIPVDGDSGDASQPARAPCPIAAVMTRVQRSQAVQLHRLSRSHRQGAPGTHLFYANGKWFGLQALYQVDRCRVMLTCRSCTTACGKSSSLPSPSLRPPLPLGPRPTRLRPWHLLCAPQVHLATCGM
jgi:hypothetical protein